MTRGKKLIDIYIIRRLNKILIRTLRKTAKTSFKIKKKELYNFMQENKEIIMTDQNS